MKNYADAEDVTQEVFLAVKRKAFQYIPGTDARAWIFQIAKNLSRDELRRRKRRADPLDGVSEIEFAVEPRLPLLNQMTNVLDESEREIVILHAIWQYKHREIAEILSLPLGTVTWKYKAALAKLRVFWRMKMKKRIFRTTESRARKRPSSHVGAAKRRNHSNFRRSFTRALRHKDNDK